MDWLNELDINLFLYLNSWRSSFGDVFFELFSGRWIWIPMYATMVFVLFRDFKWQQAIVAILVVAATITLADQIGSHVIRPLVQRPRPSSEASPIVHLAFFSGEMRSATAYGFPSCHAANTVALATLFSLFLKRQAIVWALSIWALVTCYSRIYLAAHYPGDLATGTIIGLIVAVAMYGLYKGVTILWIGNKYVDYEKETNWHTPAGTVKVLPSYVIIAMEALTVIYMLILSL